VHAESGRKPGFAALLDALFRDATTLVRQELRLAAHELQQELGKTGTAVRAFSVGIALAALGGLLLILMLVHLLQALTGLPLWACYGIIGGLCAAGGIVMLLKGKRTVSDVHMVPRKTVETIKENATWLKERIPSSKT
jgi:hypothetical protein